MAIALRYAARSDIGLGRYTNNQDSGYAGPHLLVIADGMGGHAGGDVASSITVGRMVALDGESHGGDALELLAATMREANEELRRRTGTDPALAGMGTTTTALMRYGSKLALAHIGDSRGYLLRGGTLTRITHDHSFVQSLIDEGRITPDEAERHPQRSVVTRVLTGDPDDHPDLSVREARVGDRYLLCSDGLTDVVRDETIGETLAEHDDPGLAADALVAMALRGGGRDNITCIVAHVVDLTRDDDVGTTTPVVVGAAAVHGTVRTPATADTPAAKAAALDRPAATDDDLPDAALAIAPPASAARWALRTLVTLLVLAVLGGGGYAAYAWSQDQYYVGADGTDVAIYRGLPQDIGPVSLSSVYEKQDIALGALPLFAREQVSDAITADDLTDARATVADLRQQATTCATEPTTPRAAAPVTPTTSPSATPTTTPSVSPTTRNPLASGTATRQTVPVSPTPLATDAPRPSVAPPTTTPTPTPTPTPTSTPTPVDCAGVR